MLKKYFLVFFIFVILIISGCNQHYFIGKKMDFNNELILDVLEKYKLSYDNFEEIVLGDKIIYFYQRRIGNVIVEGDYLLYKFNKNSGVLLDQKIQWRENLPLNYNNLISKKEAEYLVHKKIIFSGLYLISPNSNVFPMEQTPENPVWVILTVDDVNYYTVSLFDSVTGDFIGYGIPPPSTGFSISGSQHYYPCDGQWSRWYENAGEWFEQMGYPTQLVQWPSNDLIRNKIQSYDTAMFYELAHGSSSAIWADCSQGNFSYPFTNRDVDLWLEHFSKIPFVFIGSCGGMCDTGPDTLSYSFRKGSSLSTTTVGYCEMNLPDCLAWCWFSGYSVSWQNNLFDYMNQGYTVLDSFNMTNEDHPGCFINECMRFAGDLDFSIVPVVERENLTRRHYREIE